MERESVRQYDVPLSQDPSYELVPREELQRRFAPFLPLNDREILSNEGLFRLKQDVVSTGQTESSTILLDFAQQVPLPFVHDGISPIELE